MLDRRIAKNIEKVLETLRNNKKDIVFLNLALIIRKMKSSKRNKIVFSFSESDEVFELLREEAKNEDIEISRPFLGKLRKKIVAQKKQ